MSAWDSYVVVLDVRSKLSKLQNEEEVKAEEIINQGLNQFKHFNSDNVEIHEERSWRDRVRLPRNVRDWAEDRVTPPGWLRERSTPPPLPRPPEWIRRRTSTAEMIRMFDKLAVSNFRSNVIKAIENVASQVPDPTKEARKIMIDKIKEIEKELNNFVSSLNPLVVLKKALNEAELLCEGYLDPKIQTVVQPLGFKGVSDVNLNLEGNKIKFDLDLYFSREENAKSNYLIKLNFHIEQSITELSIPQFSDPIIDNRADEQLLQQINDKKEEMVEGLLMTLFGDYLLVFQKFKDLLGA
ncbi:hypothetical protein [Bacillus atrophaeus]|uniref:hypothetical protein n=1 Tax=Bacillus atrophaeus TaxID=1452 RepID=UPI00240E992F|nr:hypothetical protein [Bacillus atrophaeus]